jgi:hypothetical protein
MKKLVLGVVAAATLGLAAPASAQVWGGVGPGGVGVQVGPFGAGVGPAYGWGPHDRWHGAYGAYGFAGECRVIRERMITPSGRRVIRTRQICD